MKGICDHRYPAPFGVSWGCEQPAQWRCLDCTIMYCDDHTRGDVLRIHRFIPVRMPYHPIIATTTMEV